MNNFVLGIQIKTDIDSLDLPSQARVGLMIRDTVHSGSKFYGVFRLKEGSVQTESRISNNEKLTNTFTNESVEFEGGCWLAVSRSGEIFKSFYKKADNDTYNSIGEDILQLDGLLDFGIAMMSQDEYYSEPITSSKFTIIDTSSKVRT